MGRQRGIVAEMTEKYNLTEEEAWNRVEAIEAFERGDDLSDAVWFLYAKLDKNPYVAISGMRKIVHELSKAIDKLEMMSWPVRPLEEVETHIVRGSD